MERTWIVDGRPVTLAQFRASVDARRNAAAAISTAWRSGDITTTEQAQAAFRAAVTPTGKGEQ